MARASLSLLREAVENYQDEGTSPSLQKAFSRWSSGFVYNQIWEDPAVDREGLNLTSSSRIVCIASAGCNVLNYLTYGVQSVTAVDLNPNHVHLTRLKLAAAKALKEHRDFYQLFGRADSARNVDIYRKLIAPELPADSRMFWETAVGLPFLGRTPMIRYFEKAFFKRTRSGLFIRLLRLFARLHGKNLARVLSARSRQEQTELYESEIAPLFRSTVTRILAKSPLSVFSLGIPPQQFRQLSQSGGSIVDVYEERVRRLACDFDIGENYFAWQAFAQRYSQDSEQSLPDYLKASNYQKLRNAIGRAEVRNESLTHFLRKQPAGAFNCFVLLDAQDWMSHAQLDDLWREIVRIGPPSSRIVFRTAGSGSPLETGLSLPIRARTKYLADLSKQLYQRDRSAVYGAFHVYELR